MESRELEDAALLAYEKTMEEWADLTGEGMTNDQAWELIREKYLFLSLPQDTSKKIMCFLLPGIIKGRTGVG